jgi:steroid delta-isomerase-like uncharacterized protein
MDPRRQRHAAPSRCPPPFDDEDEVVKPADEHGPEPIEPDALRAFTRHYLDAWNSRSPTEVAACATEDVVWDSPALPQPGIGRQAVAGLVSATATAFPDYQFTRPSAWAISEDRLTAYVPWHMTGTNTGPFDPPGYAPTGRPIDLTGIDVWRFRGGLIWRYEAVYNYSLVARQLGLALPRNGRLERIAVRAQRLVAWATRRRPPAGRVTSVTSHARGVADVHGIRRPPPPSRGVG